MLYSEWFPDLARLLPVAEETVPGQQRRAEDNGSRPEENRLPFKALPVTISRQKQQREKMFIKSVQGDTLVLSDVQPAEVQVQQLKVLIANSEGIPVEEQRLLFSGFQFSLFWLNPESFGFFLN